MKKPSREDINQIVLLDEINDEVKDAFSKGRIISDHYSILKDEISIGYQKEFNKRIDSLKKIPGDVNHLTEVVTDAYSNGKITELHYKLLNERISRATSKDDTQNRT